MTPEQASADTRYSAVIEIRFHLGELYFLMPFLYCVAPSADAPVCLLFTRKALFEQFRGDRLLSLAAERIGAVVITCFTDGLTGSSAPDTPETRQAAARMRRDINAVLERTDLFLVQITGGYAERLLQRWPSGQPRIVRFPHTSAPALFDVDQARKQNPIQHKGAADTLLIWDPDSASYYALYGVENTVVLGYHCLRDEWLSLVEECREQREPYALVFSYRPRDTILPMEKWVELHRSTYAVIREEFPDLPITIKPHPNQDPSQLEALATRFGWTNVRISVENPAILAANARFAVSFLTGGIFNTMLLDVPSINYFNAREDYVRGRGAYKQRYAELGIPDVEDEAGLRSALRSCRDTDCTTGFGDIKREIVCITSFTDFRRRVEAAHSDI